MEKDEQKKKELSKIHKKDCRNHCWVLSKMECSRFDSGFHYFPLWKSFLSHWRILRYGGNLEKAVGRINRKLTSSSYIFYSNESVISIRGLWYFYIGSFSRRIIKILDYWSQSYQTWFFFVFRFLLLSYCVCNIWKMYLLWNDQA